MKRFLLVIVFSILFSISFITQVEARRGCCSWHGGVSGCASNGRIVCNDGTYSPSCGCTPQVATQNVVSSQTNDISENSKKIIEATKVSNSDFCRTWLDYYTTAAMLKGDTDSVAKAKVINQYDEAKDLWDNVKRELDASSFPPCKDKGCYVHKLAEFDFKWENISEKINNTYNYVVAKYHQ